MATTPEFWLRGPVEGIPPLLQPVAHALLQSREEVKDSLLYFPEEKLWETPLGLASVGFHLQHLRGVIERLFSYARSQSLADWQFDELQLEGKPYAGNETLQELMTLYHEKIEQAILQLKGTDERKLLEMRLVGRAKIPSNMLGLLFHSAEHTMRHTGQLLVTARIVSAGTTLPVSL